MTRVLPAPILVLLSWLLLFAPLRLGAQALPPAATTEPAPEPTSPAAPAGAVEGPSTGPVAAPGDGLVTGLVASVLTFEPGSLYWQRFGHNALLLRDTRAGTATTYNYGLFDFGAPDFFLNFARGYMTYRVGAGTLARDLQNYRAEGRWATEQRLNLDPGQLARLRDYLHWNVEPQNANYRYDYFLSNCSTKVRDAIDHATGGQLRQQLVGQPSGSSYRREATRLIAPDPLLMVAMDLALGPIADVPIDRWQAGFAPLDLMQSLRTATVTVAGGRTLPLVAAEVRRLPGGRLDPPAEAPDLRLQFLLGGVMLASLLLGLARFRAVATARWLFMLLATVTALLCGLAGVALAGLWAFTDHWAGWRNVSLLLANPLCLVLVPALLAYPRLRWRPRLATRRFAGLIAGLAVLALAAREIPALHQQNLHWAYLLIPVHLAIARVLLRARAPDYEL